MANHPLYSDSWKIPSSHPSDSLRSRWGIIPWTPAPFSLGRSGKCGKGVRLWYGGLRCLHVLTVYPGLWSLPWILWQMNINMKVVNNLDNQDKLRYKWCPGPAFNSSTGVSAIVEIARFGRWRISSWNAWELPPFCPMLRSNRDMRMGQIWCRDRGFSMIFCHVSLNHPVFRGAQF